jgi:hypothetical protein
MCGEAKKKARPACVLANKPKERKKEPNNKTKKQDIKERERSLSSLLY